MSNALLGISQSITTNNATLTVVLKSVDVSLDSSGALNRALIVFNNLLGQINQIEVNGQNQAELVVNPDKFSILFAKGFSNENVVFDAAPCNMQGVNQIKPSVPIKISQMVPQSTLEKMSQQDIDRELGLLRQDIYEVIGDINPTYVILRGLQQELKKQLDAKDNTERRFGSDSVKNDAYVAALNQAIAYVSSCASKTASGSSGQDAAPYDNATQVGKFGIQLSGAIMDRWRVFAVPDTIKNQQEQNKKNSNAGIKTEKVETPSAPVSVNPTLQELEAQQARAEADNKIIYVNSSGVNIFTNPAGDPMSVYSILDIMRDEQSAFIFETETVNINTVPRPGPTIGGDSDCEKVLNKLSPKQLLALIKALNDQIDYNLRLIEKSSTLINKLKNSGLFNFSSQWGGVGGFKMSDLKFNGVHFDGSLIAELKKNIGQALADTVKYAENAGKQLLDSAATAGKQISDNAIELGSTIYKTFTSDAEQALTQLKQNAKEVGDALKNISDADMSLCSTLNEVSKIAKNPTQVKTAIDQVQSKTKRDLQNMKSKIEELERISAEQEKLKGFIETLTKVLQNKTGV